MLLVIYGLMFLANVMLYANVVFLPQLLGKLGISSSFRISLFLALMGLSAGITSAVYYKIRARLSYGKIASLALLLWTCGFTAISQAPVSLLTAPGLMLFGIGQGMALPTVMRWVGDAVPPMFHGRFTSYLGTFGFVGQFLSPILFSPVVAKLGLKGVFLVAGIFCGLIFLIVLAGVKKQSKALSLPAR